MRNFTLLGLLILFSTDLFGQCSSLVFNPLTHKMDCIGPASTATTPGGSTTQCQYNNAGSFGGITGCTSNGTAVTLIAPALGTPTALVLTNATGLPAASILPGTFGAGNYTVNGNLSVGTSLSVDGGNFSWDGVNKILHAGGNALPDLTTAFTLSKSFVPATDISISQAMFDVEAQLGGSHDYSGGVQAYYAFLGTTDTATTSGTGQEAPTPGYMEFILNGGNVAEANGLWIKSTVASGAVALIHGLAIPAPVVSGGSLTTFESLWTADLAGTATNSYYSWDDSRGVRRVKEDATFDSVGQAIEALYNPLFTKYTPGAANYERVVLGQWNGNVAEIGPEKGGTGTLRPLRLLGSSLQFNSQTLAPSLTGTTGSIGGGLLAAGACASGTVAVTGSTTTMTVAVSPNTYPGDGTDFAGYVSTNGTVTVKVCALVAVTPTSSTYNVRVIQ